jgi:chemotaxis protein CheX
METEIMQTQDADISEIVRSLAEAFLGLDAQLVGDRPDAMQGQRVLTGCVVVGGAWKGAVIVTCARPFAQRAATTMLGVAPEQVTEDDLYDVMGELANVIGGNFKSLLSSWVQNPCQLSIPLVADGVVSLPGAAAAHHLLFELGNDVLRVRVLKAHDQGDRWGAC